MKEAFELIKERLEEESQYSCFHCMDRALSIVSEVEAEYGNKPQTNADSIRSMSDGELAHFLMDFKNSIGLAHNNEMSCLDWLKGVLW